MEAKGGIMKLARKYRMQPKVLDLCKELSVLLDMAARTSGDKTHKYWRPCRDDIREIGFKLHSHGLRTHDLREICWAVCREDYLKIDVLSKWWDGIDNWGA
jgi:hypothetical protein